MAEALALLWLPFAVAICLVAIHTYFGIQVLTRNVVFVDLALAQIAALGATVAFMLGHPVQGTASYAYSLAFTLAAALLLACTRQWAGRIPQEALIGVIYVVAAAAAFLLVDNAPQGAEHIKQILIGNILTVSTSDLLVIVPLYAAIGAVHAMLRRTLAVASGAGLWWADFFFYASFGLVVTSSVALAGVLLVFSFLIIPAAIGMLHARTLSRQLATGWAAGLVASGVGLALSYARDLPTGATLVCVLGAALAVAGALCPLRVHEPGRFDATVTVSRSAIALLLALSGVWLMVAPRADQPLLDAIEALVPPTRSAYMRKVELDVWRDADEHARRYEQAIEKLNAREAQSRWQGSVLDDSEVRRIASFLKSYGEMRKGEAFVMHEVRSRARERVRWSAGAVLMLGAALIAPWKKWRRARARPDEDRADLLARMKF